LISNAPPPAAADDEIDLAQLGAALARRWRAIAAGAGFGLLGASWITLTTPRTWEADFQIVLSEDKGGGSALNSILSQAGGMAGLIVAAGGGAVGASSALETERTVLQSPSVLLPVFEYVKRQLPASQTRTLPFRDWAKNNVEVEAKKGTNVLNVSYRGPSRALTLAAGRKLAATYQSYSGRKRQRILESLVTYLNEQINLYRPRADASRERAEAFANRYTLTSVDAVPSSGGGAGVKLNLDRSIEGLLGNPTGSLKTQQAELNKRILELRFQLARVRAAGDREPVMFNNTAGGPLAELVGNLTASVSLPDLDGLIAERRSRFQDNDPSIAILQRQRQVLVGAINRQLAQELENSIALAQSQLAALQRPAGVLEQFQKLSREANRDQEILQRLENALAEQQLDLARDGQPWELISSPTLLEQPVAPRPARNLALGLLAGLVLGSGAALVLDRRTDLVFASDELRTLLPFPLLAELQGVNDPSLALVAQGPLAAAPQVALIPVGPIPEAQAVAAALQAALQRLDPAAQVLLSTDLTIASRCQAQVVLTAPGTASRRALRKLEQDLRLQGQPVAGLLLLARQPADCESESSTSDAA